MTDTRSVVVALPLDHETDDILAVAAQLGARLERPLVVVHALDRRRLEGEGAQAERIADAKAQLGPRLAPLRASGLEVREEVAIRRAADLVVETAQRLGAELVVTGGGRPATVRRWLVGSVAEAVVRRASVPVWVARGTPPFGRPVLCPVDLSPQSRLGLESAIRMARALDAPLRVLTVVVPAHDRGKQAAEDANQAREAIDALLGEHDLAGLEVGAVVASGAPAEQIVDAADDAGLLVIGSRGFDPLIPDWLGPVTSRALRSSRCSVLTVREVDVDLGRREHAIASLVRDYRTARDLLDLDLAAEALPIIERAAERAPANAAIQEAFAQALERVGRPVEARGRREIAATIRREIG